jgi:hypothetical protein
MKTQNQTMFSANLMELPLMKNYSQSDIVTKVDTFRKGEKNLFWFLKLGVVGVVLWGLWQYVLPIVFVAIGKMLAVVATGLIIVALVVAAPAIFAWIRIIARKLHESAIRYDPFGQIELERVKLLEMVKTFRIAKGKISTLRQDMEVEADRCQKEGEDGQTKLVTLQGKAERVKNDMVNMVADRGVSAKGDDDYVNSASELQKILAESQRVSHKLKQSKDFVEKFGTRGNVMKKMGQKLVMVETAMDIKVLDLDATIEMLKKDYAFGQQGKDATNAVKGVLMFSKGWQFDYAMEVVTSTIAADIAITSGNLKDIDMMTSQYAIDSDELFDNLNIIADKIKTGDDLVPNAKEYRNPEYVLTSNDRLKSGGFQELF